MQGPDLHGICVWLPENGAVETVIVYQANPNWVQARWARLELKTSIMLGVLSRLRIPFDASYGQERDQEQEPVSRSEQN